MWSVNGGWVDNNDSRSICRSGHLPRIFLGRGFTLAVFTQRWPIRECLINWPIGFGMTKYSRGANDDYCFRTCFDSSVDNLLCTLYRDPCGVGTVGAIRQVKDVPCSVNRFTDAV